MADPRILVVQKGARHGYAIPSAFRRRGMLAAVYTDLVATQGIGALARKIAPPSSELAKILRRRTPPTELEAQIKAFGSAFFLRRALAKITDDARAGIFERALSEWAMKFSGTQGATHVYTMFGEGGRFVEMARAQGLSVIGDVYIALSSARIVAEEAMRHPDWVEGDAPKLLSRAERIALNKTLLTQADLFVCPSRFVRDDLVAHGIVPEKTIIAPYAVSPKWIELEVSPEPGRVLFAGSAILRKGIHILAEVAKLLEGRCTIKVAGSVSEKVRNHPAAAALEFLGHLGPAEMADEFARADIFAFPSLAEGSAGVTAEALGAGVPVVTTIEAGSIVRDGIEGSIVPSRNAEAMASAILSIVEDREKRAVMSHAARIRAQAFDWDGFVSTVIDALDPSLASTVEMR